MQAVPLFSILDKVFQGRLLFMISLAKNVFKKAVGHEFMRFQQSDNARI